MNVFKECFPLPLQILLVIMSVLTNFLCDDLDEDSNEGSIH